jgi:hypothetical protein
VSVERDVNARDRDLAMREVESLRELRDRRAVRAALRLADLRHAFRR